MSPNRRGGFTLVELLVVVAIIGILAAILVPVVFMAIDRGHTARVAIEVANLGAAMEQYKRTVHTEYPPNFTTAAQATAHIQRKFGKYTGGGTAPPAGLDAAEVLVFWLQGYGPNPIDPLAGPRAALFSFDESRLVDADGDTHREYLPPGIAVPYVYFRFDSYGSAAFTGGGTGTCKPYKKDNPTTEFVNANSFQIICAGQDGDWGANSADKRFPSGTNMNAQDRDNITNFSEGTLGDKQG